MLRGFWYISSKVELSMPNRIFPRYFMLKYLCNCCDHPKDCNSKWMCIFLIFLINILCMGMTTFMLPFVLWSSEHLYSKVSIAQCLEHLLIYSQLPDLLYQYFSDFFVLSVAANFNFCVSCVALIIQIYPKFQPA